MTTSILFLVVTLFFGALMLGLVAMAGWCARLRFPAAMNHPGADIRPRAGAAGAAELASRGSNAAERGGCNVRTAPLLPTTLRRECSWCGGFLGGDPNSPRITHGICPRCFEVQRAEIFRLNPEIKTITTTI